MVIAVAIIAVTACMFTLLKRHRGPPSPLGHADADAVIADGLALSPVVDMIVNPMRERANRGIELTNMPPQQPTLDVDINNAAGDEYQLYERAYAEVTAAAANDDDTEYELPQRRPAQEPTTDIDTYEVAVTNNPQHYTRSAVVPPTAGPVPQIYQLPTGVPTSPPCSGASGRSVPSTATHSAAATGSAGVRPRRCGVPGAAYARFQDAPMPRAADEVRPDPGSRLQHVQQQQQQRPLDDVDYEVPVDPSRRRTDEEGYAIGGLGRSFDEPSQERSGEYREASGLAERRGSSVPGLQLMPVPPPRRVNVHGGVPESPGSPTHVSAV